MIYMHDIDYNVKAMILAHTGVWSKFNEDKLKNRIPLAKKCVSDAWKQFLKSNPQKDGCVYAVEKSINILEESGIVNAGLGSARQKDGVQRMDASIMRGRDLQYGAVGSLRGFLNPISVAKIILDKDTGHNMYAHDFAAQFAREHNVKTIEKGIINEDVKHEFGTVGAVALDDRGELCSGTSTGGFGNSSPGRIGDSCIIGAGNYCNSQAAVSLTGRGENIVKLCVGKRVGDLITYDHKSPQDAVNMAIEEYGDHFPEDHHTIGIIALDKSGRFGVGYKGAAMVWSGIFLIDGKTKIMASHKYSGFQFEDL